MLLGGYEEDPIFRFRISHRRIQVSHPGHTDLLPARLKQYVPDSRHIEGWLVAVSLNRSLIEPALTADVPTDRGIRPVLLLYVHEPFDERQFLFIGHIWFNAS